MEVVGILDQAARPWMGVGSRRKKHEVQPVSEGRLFHSESRDTRQEISVKVPPGMV